MPEEPATRAEDRRPSLRERAFRRRRMVRWYHPVELLRSGVRALVAGLFGSYADKREWMASLPATPHDAKGLATDDGLWIDFIADTGDGFDATYTVALLEAQPELRLSDASGAEVATKRGSLLILGGDQVYPVPSAADYWDRLRAPLVMARPGDPAPPTQPQRGEPLPFEAPALRAERPVLVAIPGNHDWYDGLTQFQRLFCQRRRIGAWQTVQGRSYFAADLGQGWWLWGVDIQLEAYVDQAQISWFEGVAAEMPRGSKILLAIAEPTWVHQGFVGRDLHQSLAFLEDRVVRRLGGHEIRVVLSGDLHCYARHTARDSDAQDAAPSHWVMAGGGGAYLFPSHDVVRHAGTTRARVRRGTRTWTLETLNGGGSAPAVYPTPARSRLLALRALLFPGFNPAFAALLGVLYLAFGTLVEGYPMRGRHLLEPGLVSLGESVLPTARLVLARPWAAAAVAALFAGLWRGAEFPPPRPSASGLRRALGWVRRPLYALVQGVGHLAAYLTAAWLAGLLAFEHLHLAPADTVNVWLRTGVVVVAGGALGALVVGASFVLANLVGGHANDVLVCTSIKDWKHFLRLHLKDGGLDLYAIGIDRVCRRWTSPAEYTGLDVPLVVPGGGRIEERARLIERVRLHPPRSGAGGGAPPAPRAGDAAPRTPA